MLTTASYVSDNIFLNVHLNAKTPQNLTKTCFQSNSKDMFSIQQRRHVFNPTAKTFRFGYDKETFINDVAIIQLPETLNFTGRFFEPVIFPTAIDILEDNAVGKFVGWGMLDFEDNKAAITKQELEIYKISETECRAAYNLWTILSETSGRA